MDNLINNNFDSNKKSYVIKKLSKENYKDCFTDELEFCFNNPNTYLADSYIIVGKIKNLYSFLNR